MISSRSIIMYERLETAQCGSTELRMFHATNFTN